MCIWVKQNSGAGVHRGKSEGLAYGHMVRGLYQFWFEVADACAQQP